MANKFVWSGAGGGNDGSTWEDAYVTLMRDWGAEGTFTPATDRVYVRSVHAEVQTVDQTIIGSTAEGAVAAVQILCVVGDTTGTTPGNLAIGASVDCNGVATDITIDEKIYVYGVDFFADGKVQLGINASNDHDTFLEQCRLDLTENSNVDIIVIGLTSASRSSRHKLLDCTIDFSHVGQRIVMHSGFVIFDDCTFAAAVTKLFDSHISAQFDLIVRNCDLVLQTGILVDVVDFTTNVKIKFERCVLGSGFTLIGGTIDQPSCSVEAFHCQVGTDSDPAFQMEVQKYEGSIKSDTATYRAGGFNDGERTNPISWDLDTTVGSERNYPSTVLSSSPIAGWTDGDGSTAHTYRIYFASGGTQQDDDIWFDLVGPNDAATNSLGVRNTTRVAPETSPSNHTTDGASTWTGSDVGTKQYMEITYTPDKPGPIHAIVHMATDAGSTGHIFIDPKIYIDP